MRRIRVRGEEIRRFILEKVGKHSGDISRLTSDHFGITRQAVNKHLQRLVSEGALDVQGQTRNRSYTLAAMVKWREVYKLFPDLAEDVIWRNDVAPVLGQHSEEILGGMLEMDPADVERLRADGVIS